MLRHTVMLVGLLAVLVVVLVDSRGSYKRPRRSRTRNVYRARDPCSARGHRCDLNAMCVSTSRNKPAFYCLCKPGYSGTGYTCADIDECATNTDNCHCAASCNNTVGGFSCSCNAGYEGNGVNCTRALPPPAAVYKSCKEILIGNPGSPDGVYNITLNGTSTPIQVYCDMATAGGGWTLVYSYTFTNFTHFNEGSNAVTPFPTFTNRAQVEVPLSTTTPTALWDTQTGAMEYSDWQKIGEEFLTISNVTNWYQCSPNGGSLVTSTTGSISCSVAKANHPTCTTKVPDLFDAQTQQLIQINRGFPAIRWDGALQFLTPFHSPCIDFGDPLQNAAPPGGAVFIR